MSAEPQRNALTDLIARFTADRDRLIAVVQECEARVEDLVARSRGQEPAGAAAGAPAGLDEIRAAMRELHDEMQVMKTRDPNVAVQTAVGALATESAQTKEAIDGIRAECARTRAEVDRTATELRSAVEEVRGAVSQATSATPDAIWPRVEEAVAPLSEATRTLGSRLAEVERGLRLASSAAAQTTAGAAGSVGSDVVAELRASMVSVDRRIDERADEVWQRVEERAEELAKRDDERTEALARRIGERADELWQRVEQLVGPVAAATSAAAARAKDAEAATREQLASTAGRITELAATVERLEKSLQERPMAQTVTALEAKVERMLGEHRQRLEGVATDAGRAGRTLGALSDRVARLEVIVALPQQSVLSSLYAEVRDALRTHANQLTDGLPRDLWAWLARPAALFRLVSRSTNG